MKLSVIIPSYKDPLLVPTIESLLKTSELGDQVEIIVVLDGYWPSFKIVEDRRIRYVHLGKNRGMREAINAGVSVSRGEFIMRSDEHCMFGQGFDRIMVESCQPDWIMTARRYWLDPKKWAVMEEKGYMDYEKLALRVEPDYAKFEGQRWAERKQERKHIMIDETMAMQGSVWVMPRALWDRVIVALQTEGYGPLYQDSHEMVFKLWKAGGKLMLNKNTWFAHRHFRFSRTHQYGKAEAKPGWAYAIEQWKDYYLTEIKPRWNLPDKTTGVQ